MGKCGRGTGLEDEVEDGEDDESGKQNGGSIENYFFQTAATMSESGFTAAESAGKARRTLLNKNEGD